MRQNELFISYKLGNLLGQKEIFTKAYPSQEEKIAKEFERQAKPLWEKLGIEEELREEKFILLALQSLSTKHFNAFQLGLYSYGLFTTKDKNNPYYNKVKIVLRELGFDEDLVNHFYDMVESDINERVLYYTTNIRIALEKEEKKDL